MMGAIAERVAPALMVTPRMMVARATISIRVLADGGKGTVAPSDAKVSSAAIIIGRQ